MKLRGDDSFVTMCRSILVAYLALFGGVWGVIYLVHLVVR